MLPTSHRPIAGGEVDWVAMSSHSQACKPHTTDLRLNTNNNLATALATACRTDACSHTVFVIVISGSLIFDPNVQHWKYAW